MWNLIKNCLNSIVDAVLVQIYEKFAWAEARAEKYFDVEAPIHRLAVKSLQRTVQPEIIQLLKIRV